MVDLEAQDPRVACRIAAYDSLMSTERVWRVCRAILKVYLEAGRPAELTAGTAAAALLPLFPPDDVPTEEFTARVIGMLVHDELITRDGIVTEAGKRWLLRTFSGSGEGNEITRSKRRQDRGGG